MRDTRRIVERKIVEGVSPEEIVASFNEPEEKEEAEYWVVNTASLGDRRRFLVLNILLSALLGFVTLKKIMVLFAMGRFDFLMLFSLVVPCINLYLLGEIMKYRRMGYQLLAFLSLLSLVNAENREMPELIIMPCMAALAFFLYHRMFRER
jgi:hypothetical protein